MKLVTLSVIPVVCFGLSLVAVNVDTYHRSRNDALPLRTNTGTHTFGCMLNGNAWVAQGNHPAPSLIVSYDPSVNGGSLDIAAHNVEDGQHQYIYLNRDGIDSEGEYWFSGEEGIVRFDPYPCEQENSITSGRLQIARLSLKDHIIAGTFEFTLTQPGCVDWVCTKGRFDVKF
jgi:hypothetical protein